MTKKPSVTQILSEIYTFDPRMFIDSLSQEGLDKKREKGQLIQGGTADRADYLDYDRAMFMLNQLGSTVHLAGYDLGAIGFCDDYAGTLYEPYIKSLKQFWNDYKPTMIHGEKFLEGPEYVGICDGVLKVRDEYWLIDYKTWGAYKYIYGIKQDILNKNGTPKKPSDYKKVSVQLSMYENILDMHVDKRVAIWITEIGYFLFELPFDLEPYNVWKSPLKLNLS